MAQINAKYNVKNSSGGFDQLMFETSPSQVLQDTTHRFVTDTEKSSWNSKASTTVATTAVDGLMSYTDKIKLNGIFSGANNYVHPPTHAPSIIVQDTSNRFVTDTEKNTWNAKANTTVVTTTANGLMAYADKVKLNGIAAGANLYVHPSAHLATMITEDAKKRFVSDTEKAAWNAKANDVAFVGFISYFAGSVVPAGWLKANGALISRTSYSRLFAAIGKVHGDGDGVTTFKLPDLRGTFIRGLDESRGIDPSRILGSFQVNEVERHNHTQTQAFTSAFIPANGLAYTNGGSVAAGAIYTGLNYYVSGENRPDNYALIACIKY